MLIDEIRRRKEQALKVLTPLKEYWSSKAHANRLLAMHGIDDIGAFATPRRGVTEFCGKYRSVIGLLASAIRCHAEYVYMYQRGKWRVMKV